MPIADYIWFTSFKNLAFVNIISYLNYFINFK